MDTLESINAQIDALATGERLCLHNIQSEIYHATNGIGSSLLKQASISMAHYKHRLEGQWEPTDATKSALVVGNATHCLVLEPDLFDARYIEMPAEIKIRSGHKWEAFKQKHADKHILNRREMEDVVEMANAIQDEVGEMFTDGHAEVSYWYKDKSGLILKARLDYTVNRRIIDLKTNKATTPYQFCNIIKKDYDIQDALYKKVTGMESMTFVGVCNNNVHSLFLSQQGEDAAELGRLKMENTINELAFAIEFNNYPGYALETTTTELTPYEEAQLQALREAS